MPVLTVHGMAMAMAMETVIAMEMGMEMGMGMEMMELDTWLGLRLVRAMLSMMESNGTKCN